MVNLRREFFNVTLDEIREAIKECFGTITFITVPEAEEYRKTLAMREDLATRKTNVSPDTVEEVVMVR
jgi:hypothetical protein